MQRCYLIKKLNNYLVKQQQILCWKEVEESRKAKEVNLELISTVHSECILCSWWNQSNWFRFAIFKLLYQ